MLPPSAWTVADRLMEPHTPTRHSAELDTYVPRHPRAEAALTIRRATANDAQSLTALAALDSAQPLRGEILVADIEGVPVAALEQASRRAIADPLTPSGGAVALLAMRADQLDLAAAPQRRFRRRRRLVFA
jgi:hypothetical protein